MKMTKENDDFDLSDFLPYALNQAAEATSLGFQRAYKDRYGMLRSEWRVLFHLGRYGDMTAREICTRSGIHKTKVSRAVKALETKRFISRTVMEHDRRNELLSLTATGKRAYLDLRGIANDYDAQLGELFKPTELAVLRKCLARLSVQDQP